MNVGDIRKLMELMAATGLTELEWSSGENEKLRLERKPAPLTLPGETPADQAALLRVLSQLNTPAPEAPAAPAAAAAETEPVPAEPAGQLVTSPVVGVFYAAPSPDSDPFVRVGSAVEEGDPLCIIEAMKLMNEVTSPWSGVVLDILVENGQRVEYGQPLFRSGGVCGMLLNQAEIKQIIPHREPFLLVDEVESMDENTIVAYKNVTGQEDFFRGHFPDYPVMPGVLIIEAMAQAGAIKILSKPEFQGKIAFFGGIDKARFKRQVVPGDRLRLEVTLTRMRGHVGFATGKATVGGELAASADIICVIGG
jgi:3-hydroxyacyl-[acyl-carrier-protein] dehydratase